MLLMTTLCIQLRCVRLHIKRGRGMADRVIFVGKLAGSNEQARLWCYSNE